jgi:aminoglycoside phosphotransferase (APT) family kinase protein
VSTSTLPDEVRAWIEATTGGAVREAHRHLAGASRQAWSVDVERDGTTLPLFALRDIPVGGGGSMRDAAVLRALASTSVPVPHVHGNDAALGTLLLDRVDGRGDFPAVDHDDEREPTARDLMEITARLHALDPASLPIEHLGEPAAPSQHAATQLAKVEGVATHIGDQLAPLFAFALAWLRRNVPTDVARTSLVHSDMGPGNFLARGGRVTAVLDWEVAHWGDGMEDLAAVAVRDMATPIGDLATRYAEYETARGEAVDLARVTWYRVLILTRNAMLIGLGLSRDDAAVDRAQLAMYRLLLMRAAALVLCDAIGIPRPTEAPLVEGPRDFDLPLVSHAWRDQRDTVLPALDDPLAAQRGRGVAAVLGSIDHRLRFGDDHHRREMDDLGSMIGHRVDDELAAWGELRERCGDEAREAELAAYFGRHLLRRGMLFAPLLGELAQRFPQPVRATR